MQEYVDNHVVTARYLDEFSDEDGLLIAHRLHASAVSGFPARSHSVGYRKYFWGFSPSLRCNMERALAKLESSVAPALADLRTLWPLKPGSEERIHLGKFIAVHLLRTPGWKQLVPALGERFIHENRHRLDRFGLSTQEMVAIAQSEDWRAGLFIIELEVLGKMLSAMHWTLVTFDDAMLVTSDQPVVAIPFDQNGAEATVAPLPAAGLLNTLEFRFAPDPRHLLVLTWIECQDETAVISGTPWVAATANRAVRAQADEHWFHQPRTHPAFVAPPFLVPAQPQEPISPVILALYASERAWSSNRRRYAERRVHEEIDRDLSVDVVQRSRRTAA